LITLLKRLVAEAFVENGEEEREDIQGGRVETWWG